MVDPNQLFDSNTSNPEVDLENEYMLVGTTASLFAAGLVVVLLLGLREYGQDIRQ